MTGAVGNDPALVEKLVKICNRNPIPDLIQNLHVEMRNLQINDTHFPTTLRMGPIATSAIQRRPISTMPLKKHGISPQNPRYKCHFCG